MSNNLLKESSNLDMPDYHLKRVLVVEDHEVNQRVIKAILNKFQIKPDLANNGLEAINLIKSQVYDLVFMDCQMPVLDGYEASRMLRDYELSGNAPRVPIVALTAHATKSGQEKCFSAGMDDFLSKPIIIQDLKIKLERWLINKHELSDMSVISNELMHDHDNEMPPNLIDVLDDSAQSLNIDLREEYLENQALDTKQLELNFGDDEVTINEMLNLFVENTTKILKQLSLAIDQVDFTKIQSITHQLAGSSSCCGIVTFNKLIKMMGLAAQNGKEDEIVLLFGQTIHSFEVASKEIARRNKQPT